MSPPIQFPVDENTLVFAFRYALTRHTGATTCVFNQLKRHWVRLHPDTQAQIQREICQAEGREKETWDQVLGWKTFECPGCGMVYYNCLCGHGD